MSGGTLTNLASEAIDITLDTRHLIKLSISGSTLSGFRNDMSTAAVSATDTTFSSGAYGILQLTAGGTNVSQALAAILLAPSSPLPPAQRIIEIDVAGSGKENDPIRPNFKQRLVEISQLTNVPDFLKQEVKRYEILKTKGFTDEEIEAVFGEIPQHRVDLSAVTWGSFDYKGEPTMLCVVTGDNLYQTGAMLEQEDYAKSKNLKVYKPPKDYAEAVEQYRMQKKDFPHWIAGKDNYTYQTLGWEELNYFQVADTYYGNIVDGIKPNAYKNVPDWEMRNELEMWLKRLEHITALPDERDKHIKKLKEVEKKGW